MFKTVHFATCCWKETFSQDIAWFVSSHILLGLKANVSCNALHRTIGLLQQCDDFIVFLTNVSFNWTYLLIWLLNRSRGHRISRRLHILVCWGVLRTLRNGIIGLNHASSAIPRLKFERGEGALRSRLATTDLASEAKNSRHFGALVCHKLIKGGET